MMQKTDLDTPYIPRSGIVGRVHRQLARRLAKTPLPYKLNYSIVTFSFDDFPKSSVDIGAKALEARGWEGVFFASYGLSGAINHHGEQFTASDLNSLAEHGHEIGCHTFSHADASRHSADAIELDCARNRSCLKQAGLASSPVSFAFPYGEATPSSKHALLKSYRSLRGVQPGINRGCIDRGLLKAIPLDGGQAGLDRALAAINDVTDKPGWVIFYGHDIGDAPSQWGCTAAFLNTVMEAVEAAKLKVLTQSAAMDEIEAGV